MKVVDTKILVEEEKIQDPVLKEKLGGIEVPVGEGQFDTFKVISVGDKVDGINEGDIVFTYPGAGHKFNYEGHKYNVVTISDILVIR